MSYSEFLKSKIARFEPKGFDVPLDALNPQSFGDRHQFQAHVVQWALKLGCAAVFSKYGTGKTRMQLEWANQVAIHSGGKVLILAPLAVAKQTVGEAHKFKIQAVYCRSEAEAIASRCPIVVTNYEMLSQFDTAAYTGIVLDESSILKQYRGKTKEQLCKSFKATPYRLCCSATPAPNDWLELGNHCDFLGVMDSHTMISRWFQNDTMKAGGYKLRPYGQDDFWQWVASWAVCITLPSDLGFSDEGWLLPPLNMHYHVLPVDHTATWDEPDQNGQFSLIRAPALNATSIHKEARLNCDRVAQHIADVVYEHPSESWVLWCFTNYESEALAAAIPGAVELRGDEPLKTKEEKLAGFTNGAFTKIITKPEIAGLGLNWQHCHHQAFMMGTSYSFEQFHQALHRLYRFGQRYPVETHLIYPETAGAVRSNIDRKQRQYEQMQNALRKAVRKSQLAIHEALALDDYNPQVPMMIPQWLRSKAG